MTLKTCFNCYGKGSNVWVNADNTTKETKECEFCKGTGKIDMSQNDMAEKIAGRRAGGTPIQRPGELGYECPLCHEPNVYYDKDGKLEQFREIGELKFSEYRGFLWCPHCNKDIPSMFCLPDKMLKDHFADCVENYLELIADYKDGKIKEVQQL